MSAHRIHRDSTSSADGSRLTSRSIVRSFWCFGSGCSDPVAGASEIDRYQQSDMGLSDAEIKDISIGWRANMDAVHKA